MVSQEADADITDTIVHEQHQYAYQAALQSGSASCAPRCWIILRWLQAELSCIFVVGARLPPSRRRAFLFATVRPCAFLPLEISTLQSAANRIPPPGQAPEEVILTAGQNPPGLSDLPGQANAKMSRAGSFPEKWKFPFFMGF